MGNTANMMGWSVPDLVANVNDWLTMKYQGDQQRQAAEDANRFSEHMSSTTWQRGVADMRAAGINPMLAFSQGGASSPTGIPAQVPDYSRLTGGSAVGYDATNQLMRRQIAAQTANTDAATAETIARTPTHATTRQVNAQQARELEARARVGEVEAQREAERLRAEQRPGYRYIESNSRLGTVGGSASALQDFGRSSSGFFDSSSMRGAPEIGGTP